MNIAQLLWKKDATNWSGFSYTYDAASRLKEAKGIAGYNYEEIISEYDKNGNIKRLTRKGEGNDWDNLTYSYLGNRLSHVTDATGNAKGFDNGTSGQNQDYTYDAAGNLTQDANRGIAANGIRYNLLNLIGSVQMDSVLTYDYDASGTKVRMMRGGVYHTRYVGLFEYDENYFLTRIATEEGQIRVSNGGNSYAVEYYLKDHLGNVRAVLDEAGNKVQETEYFAFGSAIPKTTGSNKYLYNGKELQPKTQFLDFKWRQYDPTVARFFSVDKLADKFPELTTYQFASNDPVGKLEIDGLEGVKVTDFSMAKLGFDEKNRYSISNNNYNITDGLKTGGSFNTSAGIQFGMKNTVLGFGTGAIVNGGSYDIINMELSLTNDKLISGEVLGEGGKLVNKYGAEASFGVGGIEIGFERTSEKYGKSVTEKSSWGVNIGPIKFVHEDVKSYNQNKKTGSKSNEKSKSYDSMGITFGESKMTPLIGNSNGVVKGEAKAEFLLPLGGGPKVRDNAKFIVNPDATYNQLIKTIK